LTFVESPPCVIDDDDQMLPQPRYYSSTEMLSAVGSTRKILRASERHLLRPARATGSRRYSQECLRRFGLIVMLRRLGYSLTQIATLFSDGDGAATAGTAAALAKSVTWVIRKIDGAIRDLEIAREALVGTRATLEACAACERERAACDGCVRNGRLDAVSAVLLARARQRVLIGGADGES